ncbi:MAG TPA: OFA family MFS transporter [Cellulomonas sp.]|uniref:L-lactate MFS transporter n=1 Tax=Cellulomonas sp. TaxID=40001 RepID=UPI002E361711|nr:OFA family MFS transporter [Cellulomonas sp.]HEX5331046.1 OFA family MFS transporter [Cellulomonas sp.]
MPTINRWRVLTGSVLILLCTGAIYAFSVFAGPLGGAHGWTVPEVQNAFIINGAIAPIPMILGGFIIDRGGARWSITIGAILFALGFILTGSATSTTQLYLFYGLIAGLGQGFAYSGCLNNTIKLFPDRRGFAAGVLTAGMGAGAVIAAPVARALIDSVGVGATFVRMGVVYAVVVVAATLLIRPAPVGFLPPGWTPPTGTPAVVNSTWRQMLRTPAFYLIFVMLTAGAFSGLMIASQLSPIAQTSMFAISAATAALLVSVYSICNALGRFAWGALSDRIGYTNAIAFIYAVVALSLVVLLMVHSTFGFVVGIVGLGLCFGGVMGVFPALTMKTYGPRFQGMNYGILFTGYSVAAYFGPKIGATLGGGAKGDYTTPFVIAIVVALVGLVLTLVLSRLGGAKPASTLTPQRVAAAS